MPLWPRTPGCMAISRSRALQEPRSYATESVSSFARVLGSGGCAGALLLHGHCFQALDRYLQELDGGIHVPSFAWLRGGCVDTYTPVPTFAHHDVYFKASVLRLYNRAWLGLCKTWKRSFRLPRSNCKCLDATGRTSCCRFQATYRRGLSRSLSAHSLLPEHSRSE